MTGLFWIQFCQTRAKFIHHSFVSYLIMFKRLFKSIFNKVFQQNIKIIAGYQVKKLADWKTYFQKYSLNIYLFSMQYKKQYFCINIRIQLASTLIAIKLLLDFVVLRLWKCDYQYHHYFKSHQYLYEQMFTCVICVDISISFYLSGFASFFTCQ